MTLRRCLILALFVCGCGRAVPQDSQTKPVAKEMLAHGATTTSTDAFFLITTHNAAQRNRLETPAPNGALIPLCEQKQGDKGMAYMPCPPQVPAKPAKRKVETQTTDTLEEIPQNCSDAVVIDGKVICHYHGETIWDYQGAEPEPLFVPTVGTMACWQDASMTPATGPEAYKTFRCKDSFGVYYLAPYVGGKP